MLTVQSTETVIGQYIMRADDSLKLESDCLGLVPDWRSSSLDDNCLGSLFPLILEDFEACD